MRTSAGTLHQMVFTSPEGRREALWVEDKAPHVYRVLSVPVWVYGISVGTTVKAQPWNDSQFEFQFDGIVEMSRGGTVRFIVAPGKRANEVYLNCVVPDARRLGLYVGPATFLHPRLVAMNLYEREKWWPDVGRYLDDLVSQNTLEQWEVADPDKYAPDNKSPTQVDAAGRVLVHRLPIDGAQGQNVS